MPNGKYVDVSTWRRAAQYEFFREYEVPYFNLCAEVDVASIRTACRESGRSFALACWYACQQAVNAVPEFRLRIRDGRVWSCDTVSVAITVLNDDETFKFVYLPFARSFDDFESSARDAMRAPVGGMSDQPDNDAVIHGTTLPWLRFTSVSHPRRMPAESCVPKITFGKADDATMPVSVEVHHALMDGLHAARFFAEFEAALVQVSEEVNS